MDVLAHGQSTRKITKGKGLIHMKASLNNTIVTVTDVRGRGIPWSYAGTCGFKGPRQEEGHHLLLKPQLEMLVGQEQIKVCNEQKSW